MNATATTQLFELSPLDNDRLANLCGPYDEHLQQIENFLNVEIRQHSNAFQITGEQTSIARAQQCLQQMYEQAQALTPQKIHMILQQLKTEKPSMTELSIRTHQMLIKPRTAIQATYIDRIRNHPINFSIGPAGTGKTFLAVACAIEALEQGRVQRMVFVRPAVEAGEKLGFLPGDMAEKVLPYLRPIYDALYDMLGVEQANRLIEKEVIEIAPLAFMRGRTLNDAFIILDEAQNTTRQQMKMFLTRIGYGSTAVITGDQTQVDLPDGTHSGLAHAVELLSDLTEISFTHFSAEDTVRHPLVQHIINAYEQDK